jgi:PAS domain S-box-containing protein
MTLRTKTSILLAVIIIIALGATGFFYLRFFQQTLKNSILSSVETVAATTSQSIARFLDDSLKDTQAVALALPIRALEKNNLPPVEERLRELAELYPKFENGMFILDNRGRVWVDYPPHPAVRGVDVSFREYFKRTMREKKGVIGVPYISKRTGQPVLTFTAFLQGSANQVLGVLGCSVQILSPSALEGIRKIRLGKSGYIYVYDRSRLMILHPDARRVLKRDVPPGANRLFDAALEGFEGIGETVNSRGVPMLLALKHVPGTDWIVGAQQLQSEVYAPLVAARQFLLIGIILAVIAAVGVGTIAIRRITYPLARLRQSVLLLGTGEYEDSSRITEELGEIRTRDEIGELAGAFQDLSHKLQETMVSLKRASSDWERTFNTVPDLITIIDNQDNIVKINQPLAGKLGVKAQEVLGLNCRQLFYDLEAPVVLGPPPQEAEAALVTVPELMQKKLGRDFLVTASSLKGPDGEVVGSVYVARDISEIRRAEEALRQINTTLQALIQASPVAIIALDSGGKVTLWNPAAERTFGWSEEEALGQYLPYVPENKLEEFNQRRERVLRGEVKEFEVLRQRKDGSPIDLFISAAPLFDARGQVTGIMTLNVDITERKQADAALRASEEYLKSIMDSVHAGIMVIDAETCQITDINLFAEKMIGISREQIIGQTCHQHVCPAEIGKCPVRDQELTVDQSEHLLINGRGQTIPILKTVTSFQKDGHKFFLESFVDITARKLAEEALSRSEEKYRQLVKQIPTVVFKGYPDWSLECFDQKIEEITGYSMEDFNTRRKTWFDLIFLEDLDQAKQLFLEARKGDGNYVSEHRIRKNTGEVRWVQTRNRIIYDRNGKVDHISGVFFDITERKQLEDQLTAAQRMEAVGILAGGLAHDFNNLLTAIMGYSEIMMMDLAADDPLSFYVGEIKKATKRGASLTNQLLAFSRRQILQPQIIDINTIVTNLNQMLQRLIGEDIELATYLHEELWLVRADPSQIEQIIMNLAVNARDAMPHGGRLTLETVNIHLDEPYTQRHVDVKPGAYVMLAVSDNGLGMDAETLSHIFEPFFTTKEVGKGTGLGLATVYGIVKQSNGHLWVYSEPGQGTTFKIYFPRVEEVLKPDKPARVSPVSLTGSETILVVEDDAALRELVVRAFRKYGYKVLAAGTGGEALLITEKEQDFIHLLLTDVVMPQMSGSELAARLTRLYPDLKVIYMSGYTENAIVHRGVLMSGINFIQKPFKVINLLEKARAVIDGSQPS